MNFETLAIEQEQMRRRLQESELKPRAKPRTRPRTRTPIPANSVSAWALGNPQVEALAMVGFVRRRVMTINEVLELISVPREVLEAWKHVPNPGFRAQLLTVHKFRCRVLRKFNELLKQAEKG